MNEPDKALMEEAFLKAEDRLRALAAEKIHIKEFSRRMNMLQMEAQHTLGLLILNSWLMNGKKGTLFDSCRIVIRGIEADLKALGAAQAEGRLDSEAVAASDQDTGAPDDAA